ncbi:hypothetical protein BJ170DRAFT_721294 [Xylariales sp. AK1849]|nr:hypothetical protein BJ170DRAFT_721294 [Xylariales sp. AK1849]
MSHPPSTPVKVPASAATYTPATLDADLRSQINALLIKEGHIEKIQDHFLHTLDAHSSNWPSTIQSHALTLLRNGEVSTFPALIRRVLEDVRNDMQSGSSNESTTKAGSEANGAATTNGTTAKAKGASTNGASSGGGGALAIPQSVVEEVLKFARVRLEVVCELDDGGT